MICPRDVTCKSFFIFFDSVILADMEKQPRAATGRDSDKYILRFIDGLSGKIRAAARENGRSINAEINARLQSSFYDAGNSETKGKLIVALTTLRMLHRLETDAVLKQDVGALLAFLGNADEGTEAASAAQALERLGQRSEKHSGQ